MIVWLYVHLQFRSNKGAAVGASKKAGNPLSGVSTPKISTPKISTPKISSKVNKVASKASAKVPCL